MPSGKALVEGDYVQMSVRRRNAVEINSSPQKLFQLIFYQKRAKPDRYFMQDYTQNMTIWNLFIKETQAQILNRAKQTKTDKL